MKTIITIDTPVHVGTGETSFGFEYKVRNNIAEKYALEDILGFVPNDVLLNSNFHKKLLTINSNYQGQGISPSEQITNVIKNHVNYSELPKEYILKCGTEDPTNKKIDVQIKALNKPIIPGSTMKGAIFNAINYHIIKNNFNQFCNLIDSNEYRRSHGNKITIDMLIKSILDKDETNQYDEFMSQFRSCLICSDIPCEKLRLLEVERYYIDFSKDKLNLPLSECIDMQTVEGNFININEDKKTLLQKTINKHYANTMLDYLNKDKLISVINDYFFDMLAEEKQVNEDYGYYDEFNFKNKLYSYSREQGNGYLRIGANTNYFF
ncbi:MAG: type III-A CRISPR-associated RAMP protein Csm5, partial [Erysipelotrichaceae bacterium]|nr:type III-A CRISPR-associated RAMP protein Csm5 [Erysipelotrichaceae bacterium]